LASFFCEGFFTRRRYTQWKPLEDGAMFGKRYTGDGKVGQTRDTRLHDLLGMWQGIEPRTGFESGVWQRIHAVSTPATGGITLAGMIQGWILPHPALVTALAASVAIVVGAWAGGGPAVRASRSVVHPLLHAQTLAGAYLAMSAGEMQ